MIFRYFLLRRARILRCHEASINKMEEGEEVENSGVYEKARYDVEGLKIVQQAGCLDFQGRK